MVFHDIVITFLSTLLMNTFSSHPNLLSKCQFLKQSLGYFASWKLYSETLPWMIEIRMKSHRGKRPLLTLTLVRTWYKKFTLKAKFWSLHVLNEGTGSRYENMRCRSCGIIFCQVFAIPTQENITYGFQNQSSRLALNLGPKVKSILRCLNHEFIELGL